MNFTLDDLAKAKKDIEGALDYFRVIADTLPRSTTADRHIAKLSGVLVKINSLATLQEYGS